MKKKIAIVDYGSGNQKSLYNLLKYLGYDPVITDEFSIIEKSEFLILPGVGSFSGLMTKLKNKNLIKILNEQVIIKKKKYLGICVGMQILVKKGYEFGECDGLGWIDGEVSKIISKNLPLPHVGWNNIEKNKPHTLCSDLDNESDFYFVNSYSIKKYNNNDIIAFTNYNEKFPSIINKENIYGVQFHPEKSQVCGKIILKNFLEL
jgi:imidazole glycerol-phosphate synthase subunit HisH